MATKTKTTAAAVVASDVTKYLKDDFITDLQAAMKEKGMDISKDNLNTIINTAGDIITTGMTSIAGEKQNEVHLKMFNGTFKAQFHKAGTAKNPKDGSIVEVPARTQIKFSTPRKDV